MTSDSIQERYISMCLVIIAALIIGACTPRPQPAGYCEDSNWAGRYQEAPAGIHPGVRAASYYYRDCIQPIWTAKCENCHAGTGWGEWQHNLILKQKAGDTRESPLYTSYEQLVWVPNIIIPGQDGNGDGRLLQSLTGTGVIRRMPFGCSDPAGTCLSTSEIEKIKRWIKNMS
jgi:hypothetical protein